MHVPVLWNWSTRKVPQVWEQFDGARSEEKGACWIISKLDLLMVAMIDVWTGSLLSFSQCLVLMLSRSCLGSGA